MIKEANGMIAIPPGETIKEQLSYRHISQKEFASRMGYSEKHISRLINGEVELTHETALRLENVLGISAEFWNRYEGLYRTTLLKIDEYEHLEKEMEIAKRFPYQEMSKYGWVSETKKTNERVINLRKFFEVASLNLFGEKLFPHMATRRLEVTAKSDVALLAFMQRAKLLARDRPLNEFRLASLKNNLPILRKLTKENNQEGYEKLKKVLEECGVTLVYLESLKGSFLQGVTFLDEKKIIIAISDRGAYADKFYFSLFHEIAHLLLNHLGEENIGKKEESEADNLAAEILLPSAIYGGFVGDNHISKETILTLAKDQDIAPGIIVGRLQKDGFLPYDKLNDLREKISFC